MTDTDLITTSVDTATDGSSATEAAPKGRTKTSARTGLAGMVLSELRALAGELGIKGTSGMRKGDLIAAIKERQGGGSSASAAGNGQLALGDSTNQGAESASVPADTPPADTRSGNESGARSRRRGGDSRGGDSAGTNDADEKSSADRGGDPAENRGQSSDTPAATTEATSTGADSARGESRRDASSGNESQRDEARNPDSKGSESKGGDSKSGDEKKNSERAGDGDGGENRNRNRNRDRNNRNNNGDRNSGQNNQGGNQNKQGGGNQGGGNQGNQGGGNQQNNDDDEDGNGRGRRGRRFRERRRGRDRDPSGEPQIAEDDVVQPVAGILDVLDNYAFVRTSGYLAGPNDVYVSMNLVRKNGLRRGDAITGAVKVSKDGDQQNQRQKFNPLVRLDTVNGTDVDTARKRPEFGKLTPLYPNQRLRLETTKERLSTRVIDLIMPIGKGQRALIVSPPKAGKTTILQDIANAITTNNPECHLMVVLVDERPEEVTDMTRSVNGEVIASTFDRPPSDHTSVAELAIERAKRLVEGGKDVVVLLDSITRLGRAYNNASPASGRILSGGVDSTALYPPKRFLGAARNIENGGSLTIIASALVETGSTGDTVIFEEFKGTGNAELKLDRKISERRVFPAVDVNLSSTRKDELLLSPEEFSIVHKLRRVLSGLDSQQAIDLLVSQLKKTQNNIEFLMQVQKTAPGSMNDD
ncbi:transcription termination factor Rho [Gordonia soli]|uniref:Transcription termination factor Rho n=1 Tax=Gordonia soli NBRC 108243 TaxID=1223545 RepID=M0QPT2_9ACTN|nr:transcription termination factor Rho [Gordonia soli]GAC70700.1 transcription termination factor Rho [Gordonia soli NBRC 108243]